MRRAAAARSRQHIDKVARKNLPLKSTIRIKPANAFRKRGQPMMEFWLIFCLFIAAKCLGIPPVRCRCGKIVYVKKTTQRMNVNSNSPRLLHVTGPKHQSCWLFLQMSERVVCVEEYFKQGKKYQEQKNKYPKDLVGLPVPWNRTN